MFHEEGLEEEETHTGLMKENISLVFKLLHWLCNVHYMRKSFVQKYNFLYCLWLLFKC